MVSLPRIKAIFKGGTIDDVFFCSIKKKEKKIVFLSFYNGGKSYFPMLKWPYLEQSCNVHLYPYALEVVLFSELLEMMVLKKGLPF